MPIFAHHDTNTLPYYGSVLVVRKTYNFYGRLITVPEDLKLLRDTFVTAPEHFRNCSGALS